MKLLKIFNALITEVVESNHIIDRLKSRVDALSFAEISNLKKEYLSKYLDIVKSLEYDPKYSFAIKIIDLEINQESNFYVNINGREYYRINDFLGKDSTGNQIWVIIRNNKLMTTMLRKNIQPTDNLRVDYILKNIDDLQKMLYKKLVTQKNT